MIGVACLVPMWPDEDSNPVLCLLVGTDDLSIAPRTLRGKFRSSLLIASPRLIQSLFTLSLLNQADNLLNFKLNIKFQREQWVSGFLKFGYNEWVSGFLKLWYNCPDSWNSGTVVRIPETLVQLSGFLKLRYNEWVSGYLKLGSSQGSNSEN